MKATNKNERSSYLINLQTYQILMTVFSPIIKKNIDTLQHVLKLNYLELKLYSPYFHLDVIVRTHIFQ